MADKIGLENQIKKVEKTSLQKFKNQNKVLKKFGKVGLKVYRAVRKRGISIQELMEKTNVEQEKLFEILLFLKEKKMIDTVGRIKEPQIDEETEMVEPEGLMEEVGKTPAKKKAQKAPPATIAPEGEVVSEEEMGEKLEEGIVPEEEETLAPSAETEEPEEEEMAPEEEFGISEEQETEADTEEALPPLKEEPLGEEEILPLDLSGDESGEEETPSLEKPSEEEEGEEDIASEEEEEDDIIPQESRNNNDESEEEEDEDIFLTPGERKIKAQYGQVGIDVYNLIDGQRTAEEIMKTTGVTETTLIEMLDFMEKKGIIKLEHPGARKGGAKKPAEPAAKEVGFAPMVEETGMPAGPLKGELGKQFTLEVPSKVKGNMFKSMQMKANLMIKYQQAGAKAYELINGSRDAVELALKTGLPLYRVYKVLNYLEKEGMIKLVPATREEIKRKYGEDGYSVYKKYGREGVMLYQLIGKDMDLREMALQTSEDKKRVVEIFMFIHRLLGIDLPIDEDVLLERLESIPESPKK